ncbi:hypothetical protein RFI_03345 [Reticulomyxa filosa]|uniref:Uncharacterized protein n=1 Tax=Reticulomyxa filosa TaxID=46433 RepID=X6P5C4_RETFI|nr:hypothetical protein RFI_03345 [Reticulomyxa filosa]|eukprot:ETO33755.1 hypothetical protein RFI_03345 [Reticulomyxa filosa]
MMKPSDGEYILKYLLYSKQKCKQMLSFLSANTNTAITFQKLCTSKNKKGVIDSTKMEQAKKNKERAMLTYLNQRSVTLIEHNTYPTFSLEGQSFKDASTELVTSCCLSGPPGALLICSSIDCLDYHHIYFLKILFQNKKCIICIFACTTHNFLSNGQVCMCIE